MLLKCSLTNYSVEPSAAEMTSKQKQPREITRKYADLVIVWSQPSHNQQQREKQHEHYWSCDATCGAHRDSTSPVNKSCTQCIPWLLAWEWRSPWSVSGQEQGRERACSRVLGFGGGSRVPPPGR